MHHFSHDTEVQRVQYHPARSLYEDTIRSLLRPLGSINSCTNVWTSSSLSPFFFFLLPVFFFFKQFNLSVLGGRVTMAQIWGALRHVVP